MLDYYRRTLAPTITAPSSFHDKGGSVGDSVGDSARDSVGDSTDAFVPLVVPSSAAVCIDAVSRLWRHGRRMLCIASDKVRRPWRGGVGAGA